LVEASSSTSPLPPPPPPQIHILAVHVQRLKQSLNCFVLHDNKFVVKSPLPSIVNINIGDVIVEVAGRSLLCVHDSRRIFADVLAAATTDMILVAIVRSTTINPPPLPPPPPAAAVVLPTSTPHSTALFPAPKVSDGALLKRLDEAHLRLQSLMVVEYDQGQKMPDISTLPTMSSPEAQATAAAMLKNSAVGPTSHTSPTSTFDIELPIHHPLLDLGFALAPLPFATEGGTVVIHSVWNPEAVKVRVVRNQT